MKKICTILVLCLMTMLVCCKKKLPTSPDISTKVLPTIASFTANPTSIALGESSTLSWSTTNATNVTIDHGIGTVSTTGTVDVSPEETTTYTLTATNSDGQKTASCEVEVTEVILSLPVIEYFTANPESIGCGEYSELSWSATNTTTLTIEKNGSGALSIPLTGTESVSPIETTTYMLTATNDDGQTTASCTVEVVSQAAFHLYYEWGGFTAEGLKVQGTLSNEGCVAAYGVVIVFQVEKDGNYLATTTVVVGDIAPDNFERYEAIFVGLYEYPTGISFVITWFNAQGVRMTQAGTISK